MPEFTEEELAEFTLLVDMSGSSNQMDRIDSRLAMPGFVNRVGKDKCDAMWEIIKNA